MKQYTTSLHGLQADKRLRRIDFGRTLLRMFLCRCVFHFLYIVTSLCSFCTLLPSHATMDRSFHFLFISIALPGCSNLLWYFVKENFISAKVIHSIKGYRATQRL